MEIIGGEKKSKERNRELGFKKGIITTQKNKLLPPTTCDEKKESGCRNPNKSKLIYYLVFSI